MLSHFKSQNCVLSEPNQITLTDKYGARCANIFIKLSHFTFLVSYSAINDNKNSN